MAVDAGDLDAGQAGGAAVEGQGILVGDAELVLLEAGGNIGVGLGIHIGIDPQAQGGLLAQAHGDGVEAVQLGHGLDVEAADAHFQGPGHFRFGLADAGEDHLAGLGAGRQDPFQFAAGNDVETGAKAGEEAENAQVGVGLDGVADQAAGTGGMGGQGIAELAVGGFQGGPGIDVGGRAEPGGDAAQGNGFGVQDAVFAGEEGHCGCIWEGEGDCMLGLAPVFGAGRACPSAGGG